VRSTDTPWYSITKVPHTAWQQAAITSSVSAIMSV
jgi:hypothetical protein